VMRVSSGTRTVQKAGARFYSTSMFLVAGGKR
jgi:hypothetical protein